MKAIRKLNIFYGWFIVAAAFSIMAIGWGGVYNCSSIFIQPITKELGFTRSAFNVTMTIRAVCQMGTALLIGKIYRRFDMMRVMKVSSVILVISFAMYSTASTLLMFYLITVIVSISLSLISILPLAVILSNWFEKGRGSALGLAFMGSGVGGMILSSLSGIWIQSFGWRVAYQFLAILMLVIIVPSVFLILKVHPSEIGLSAYGVTQENAAGFKDQGREGLTLRQAMQSVRFWAINISSVFLYIAVNSLMMNVAPHLTDIGYSITFSANIVALIMGSLAVGKFLFGKLYDRFSLKTTILCSCLSTFLALSGLVYAQNYIGLVFLVVFVGVGSAYATIANSVLTIELFGKKDYNSIYGFLTAFGSIGSVIGPILTGLLYDASGSYILIYAVSIVLTVIALGVYFVIFAQKRPAGKLQEV